MGVDLFSSIRKGDTSSVFALLNMGIDVSIRDFEGKTPLIYAAIYNQIKIVQALLDRGVDIGTKDNFGKTALMYAMESGHTNIIIALSNVTK